MAALAYQEIPEERIEHVNELITQYFQRFIDQMRTEFGTMRYVSEAVTENEGDDEVVKKNKAKKRIVVNYLTTLQGRMDASQIVNSIDPFNYSSESFEIMEAIMTEVTSNPAILDPISVVSILMANSIRGLYDLGPRPPETTLQNHLRHVYTNYTEAIQDDAERDEVIATMHDIVCGPPCKKKGGRKSKRNKKSRKYKKRSRRNL